MRGVKPCLLSAALLLSGLTDFGAQAAWADNAARKGSAEAGKADQPRKKKPSQSVSVQPGSAETPSERAARLKRECKGLPNAGACTGYAQ